jgi:hypothetical protein
MADSMVNDVSYHQPCPVCGRTLRIGVMLLGRQVYCQHCGGGFVAGDPALGRSSDVLERGDRLLEQAALVLEQAAR